MVTDDAFEPKQKLFEPLTEVPGVGPQNARLLQKLGLTTAADLLFHFPRRYEDFSEVLPLARVEIGKLAQVVAQIKEIDQQLTATGRHVLYLLVEEQRNFLRVVFFNQAYLAAKFRVGQTVLLRGSVGERGGRLQMVQPKFQILDPSQSIPPARLLPVYGLTEGLRQRNLRQIMQRNVPLLAPLIDEALPEDLRNSLALPDIQTALLQIHFPDNLASAEQARQRLAFQELFILQLALATRRFRLKLDHRAPLIELTPAIRDRILARLPFNLTASQLEAFDQIAQDMARDVPMNRLLQGDVGSGKTAVAVAAMLNAVASGHQAVLMAPTEILARQHEQNLRNWLKGSRVRVALWTGSTGHREQLAGRIAQGEVDIVIGTQAIVQGNLQFKSPGLTVVDEQHKFGVRQRALLRGLGNVDPHYLVMTATPIPRTMAMTVFGDLDISSLTRPDHLKPPVHTYLGNAQNRDQWWTFVIKKLREGRQGLVIAPRVHNDEQGQIQSAEQLFESLVNGPLESFRVDLLHGQQDSDEQAATLQAFALGKTQILVATSIVEVGIDVPNATVMTIESAERFGLSQLHQLRGRVGRGRHPGFVCAFSTSDQAVDRERLQAFADVSDGFELAEIDFRLRGPGNLFGAEQTGFPPLRIADLVRDSEWLIRSRSLAESMIQGDPELKMPEHARLQQLMTRRYGKTLELSDVG